MRPTRFGQWLRGEMKKHGIRNQSDLAERLGVVPSAVSNWVNGAKEPDTESVNAIARLFGVSVARVYEALGRMAPVTDADYRDWVELLEQTDPESRDRVLSYARWELARKRQREQQER